MSPMNFTVSKVNDMPKNFSFSIMSGMVKRAKFVLHYIFIFPSRFIPFFFSFRFFLPSPRVFVNISIWFFQTISSYFLISQKTTDGFDYNITKFPPHITGAGCWVDGKVNWYTRPILYYIISRGLRAGAAARNRAGFLWWWWRWWWFFLLSS